MKAITKEWLQAARDDLEVVDHIIHLEHLTHVVGYHCQQAIEKVFKAIIEEYNLLSGKIHDLVKLYSTVKDYCPPIDKDLLSKINELSIDSRYPGEFGLLPQGKPTLNEAAEFCDFSKEIYKSINSLLKKQ